MFIARTITLVAGTLAATASAAGAASTGGTRIDYRDGFTTQTPGAAAGRVFRDEFFNASDPNAKPPALAHFRLDLPSGARFDTGAIEGCSATDAQLMAMGDAACPSGSRLGTEILVFDTGAVGPQRFISNDVTFLNEPDGLIIVSRERQSGVRVVTRGKVGARSEDIDLPPLPGTPPEGGADKREDARFALAVGTKSGRPAAYLTTPATCPSTGLWVFRATYTFRNGARQVKESGSPCLSIRFDPRPRSGRGHSGVLRVKASEPASGRIELRRNGRLVRGRGVSLRPGQNRVHLPHLRPGRYRLTLRATGSSGARASRAAVLTVR